MKRCLKESRCAVSADYKEKEENWFGHPHFKTPK